MSHTSPIGLPAAESFITVVSQQGGSSSIRFSACSYTCLASSSPLYRSAYVNTELKVGDTVHIDGPHGISYYRVKHTGPIVALAGGSGLAPIKSIVEEALAQGAGQPIHMYFGVRDERDLYLQDHFSDLAARHPNLSFIPVLSEPGGKTPHRTGYLADVVAADFADLDGSKVYLAGPPIMVETCVERVHERGTADEDCHADAFYTEADKAKLEAAP